MIFGSNWGKSIAPCGGPTSGVRMKDRFYLILTLKLLSLKYEYRSFVIPSGYSIFLMRPACQTLLRALEKSRIMMPLTRAYSSVCTVSLCGKVDSVCCLVSAPYGTSKIKAAMGALSIFVPLQSVFGLGNYIYVANPQISDICSTIH